MANPKKTPAPFLTPGTNPLGSFFYLTDTGVLCAHAIRWPTRWSQTWSGAAALAIQVMTVLKAGRYLLPTDHVLSLVDPTYLALATHSVVEKVNRKGVNKVSSLLW